MLTGLTQFFNEMGLMYHSERSRRNSLLNGISMRLPGKPEMRPLKKEEILRQAGMTPFRRPFSN